MQRWSFRRRCLSWETSFDWSEMKIRALPGVSSHPAVRTRPGFQIKWTQPDFHDFSCGPYLQLRIAVLRTQSLTGEGERRKRQEKGKEEQPESLHVEADIVQEAICSDFSDVTRPAMMVLQIDVCSGIGGGGGGWDWHTRVHATRPGLRTKMLLWQACDRYGVQGHVHQVAHFQVRLQSVKENLLCRSKEVLEVIFRQEGRRTRQ